MSNPFYYLWVYDPHTGDVTVEHNDDRHPADAITHSDLAEIIPHPGRTHGYAYRIENGWRITDENHSEVLDPNILHEVKLKLKGAENS